MTILADTERFEREDEYDGRAEIDASEKAVRVCEIMAPVLAALEQASRKLYAEDLIDPWMPGCEGPFGYVPSLRLGPQQVIDQIRAEVRATLVAWLPAETKALVEE